MYNAAKRRDKSSKKGVDVTFAGFVFGLGTLHSCHRHVLDSYVCTQYVLASFSWSLWIFFFCVGKLVRISNVLVRSVRVKTCRSRNVRLTDVSNGVRPCCSKMWPDCGADHNHRFRFGG